MEIPVINRISDFELGINSLQSQSLLSLSGVERIPKAYSFWKWGALVLAILASFSAIIRRIKFLIIKFKTNAASRQEPLLRALDDEYSSDDTCTLSSSSSDYCKEDDEEDNGGDDDDELIWGSQVDDGQRQTDEIFKVKGVGFNFLDSPWLGLSSSGLRRRSSIADHFSEFASGKSVVKLWDNLGLGLGFELDGDDPISWVTNPPSSPPSHSGSPAELVVGKPSAAALGFWDARAGGMRPAILAEWGTHTGSVDAVSRRGVGKVYLRGGGGELAAVGDLRKVNTPLDNLTGTDVETWWDVDAVVVNDELAGGGGSVQTVPGRP